MPENNSLVLNPNYCIIGAEGHAEMRDVGGECSSLS